MALRKQNWKLVQYDVNRSPMPPPELYNLADDLSETNNLAQLHPEKLKELSGLMAGARTSSEVFKFTDKTYKGQVD